MRADDDAPLDAVEQALVRMWIDIIAAEIRATLADEQRREADEPAATRGVPSNTNAQSHGRPGEQGGQ